MSMTRVREPQSGRPVTCAWDDCERPAWDELKIRVRDSRLNTLDYIFCTERHQDYWRWSHVSNGNLPPGSRLIIR